MVRDSANDIKIIKVVTFAELNEKDKVNEMNEADIHAQIECPFVINF